MEELSAIQIPEHNSPKDAWIIIHGLVYDVTRYLKDHPGGADVLTEAAGGDASEKFDNAGHSEDAFEVMKQYCVGKLKGFERKRPKLKPVDSTAPLEISSARSTTTAPSVSQLANITVFSLTVAAVYYVGHRQIVSLSLPEWMISQLRSGLSQQHELGFFKGALIGGGVSAAAAALLAKRFIAQTLSSKTFTSYLPQINMPKRIQEDALLERGLLDPLVYQPLPLKTKTLIAPNVFRFIFSLPTAQTILGLPTGQHVIIKADVSGESVARSYTPVSNNSDRGILELVTKVYQNGKLSSFLANLTPGDHVQFRGPKGSMRYRPGLCNKIGMIAGGTGITPMYQVIRAICESERDTTEVSLIYANRTKADILLREELDTFAKRYPKNVKVYYMLEYPPVDWAFGSGFITQEIMAERLPRPGLDSKIMICGPPGMVHMAKRALVNLGFKQPAASAKASDEIFCF